MNEEQAKLKAGDVVRLKSGGPAMRVEAINEFGLHLCSWSDDEGITRVAEFPACSLVYYVSALDTSKRDDLNARFRKITYRRRFNLFIVEVMAWVTFLELLSRRSVLSVLPTVAGVLIGTFLCWVIDKLWDRYAG